MIKRKQDTNIPDTDTPPALSKIVPNGKGFREDKHSGTGLESRETSSISSVNPTTVLPPIIIINFSGVVGEREHCSSPVTQAEQSK